MGALSGLDMFKAEAQAVAEKWGKQIKLERAPKDCPTHPFPLVLQRTIPQPETAAQWDVDKLVVRLRLGNKDPNELDVKVGIANKDLPSALRKGIGAKLEAQWKGDLAAAGGSGWFL